MLDEQTRREMRDRSTAYRKAVEVMLIAAEDGMFAGDRKAAADAVLPAAIDSARDVPRLLDAVERLSPAAYVFGLEACREHECDHVDREADPYATCPELEERVATLADVKRAEHLDALAKALKRAAEVAQRGGGIDDREMARIVIEAVDTTYEQIEADDDIREVVPPAALVVGAELAGYPHDRDPDHGGDR